MKIQVKDLPRLQQAWAITIGCIWTDYVWVKNGRVYKRRPHGLND